MNFETRLIAEVKKYDCLYNCKSLNYKDVTFKDKLWQKVAQNLGSNVDETKKKWKHLRDCYHRSRKRALSQPSDEKGRRKRPWRYTSEMKFLSQYPHPKQDDVIDIKIDKSITIGFNDLLIKEVRKHRCLYDKSMKTHEDTIRRKESWSKIAKVLDTTPEDCRKRWKNLRDSYQRRKNDPVQHKWKWKYLDVLSFVDCKDSPGRQTYGDDQSFLDDDDSEDYFKPLTAKYNQPDTTNDEQLTKTEQVLIDESSLTEDTKPNMTEHSYNSNREITEERNTCIEDTMFPDFLESTMPSTSRAAEEDSTTLMFKMLDRKIKQARLTEEQISDLETSVMLFVYKRLGEFKD